MNYPITGGGGWQVFCGWVSATRISFGHRRALQDLVHPLHSRGGGAFPVSQFHKHSDQVIGDRSVGCEFFARAIEDGLSAGICNMTIIFFLATSLGMTKARNLACCTLF